MVAERSGASPAAVVEAVKGHLSQLRRMPELDAIGQLILEIPQVAEEYGGRSEIPENVLSECVRFVLKKFANLGVNELREAYRSWAAGEIEVEGGEMYGGRFNAAQLGKVLASYEKSRRKVVAAYLRARDEMQAAAEDAARTERLKAEFERRFPVEIRHGKNTFRSWQDVPEFWYKALRSRGLMTINSEEGSVIFDRAKALAEKEALEEKQQRRNIFQAIPHPDDRAKIIARKLAVWEKVIQNQNFKYEPCN